MARREGEAVVVVAVADNDSDLVNYCEHGTCLCEVEVEEVFPPFCSDPTDAAAVVVTDVAVAACADDGVPVD